jgi:NTP pyrophosphatase (non-canonical NTP hydrolase)
MTKIVGASFARALVAVEDERESQQKTWGAQRHDFPVWLTVLTEEVGELAQAILRRRQYQHSYPGPQAPYYALATMREEAAQVAAVAVAIIEHIDEIMEGASDGEQATTP